MITITSPVPSGKFSGTVEVPEYLTFPQVVKIDEIISIKGQRFLRQALTLWPIFRDITGEWHIEGINKSDDVNTIEFTPVQPGKMFVGWLLNYFSELIIGETAIPNASRPDSGDMPKTPANVNSPQN